MMPIDANSKRDVIVIGGGVVGCWTAHYLMRSGRRVTLIDRDRVGSGASSGNCGYICPSHVMPLCEPGAIAHSLPALLSRGGALSIPLRYDPTLWRWLAGFARKCTSDHQRHAAVARDQLLKTSMELYRRYIDETRINCDWQDRGLLMVHRSLRTMDAFEKTAGRLSDEFGLPVDRYDGDQLTDFESTLVDGLAGGWYFPADSHLNPASLTQSMRASIQEDGGEVVEGTEVRHVDVKAGRVVGLETPRGRFTAEQYVLTMGAEAPRFAKPLGCCIPIVPGKGYSMNFHSIKSMPRVPMIFEDSHVAITPLDDRLRIGSTMQLAGYDRSIDRARVNMIRDNAQTYLREPITGEPQSIWAGWRPMVYDDLPCIDQSPAAENAFIAAGNGMIGLSTGSGTGKLIAQLVCQETPHIDPGPFSLRRFQGNRRSRSHHRQLRSDDHSTNT